MGVLLGDLVVYFLGYFYGEKVLSLPLTRKLLTRQREAQIKGYFHRHGFKILVSGRFVPGFRTAAYLDGRYLATSHGQAILDRPGCGYAQHRACMFGLGYAFAHQIQSGIREVQQWIMLILAVGVASWLLYRYYDARNRSGMPIGPPVLDSDEMPIPDGDVPTAPTPSRQSVPPHKKPRSPTMTPDRAAQ